MDPIYHDHYKYLVKETKYLDYLIDWTDRCRNIKNDETALIMLSSIVDKELILMDMMRYSEFIKMFKNGELYQMKFSPIKTIPKTIPKQS